MKGRKLPTLMKVVAAAIIIGVRITAINRIAERHLHQRYGIYFPEQKINDEPPQDNHVKQYYLAWAESQLKRMRGSLFG